MNSETKVFGAIGMTLGLIIIGLSIHDLITLRLEWYEVVIPSLIGIIVFHFGYNMFNYKKLGGNSQ